MYTFVPLLQDTRKTQMKDYLKNYIDSLGENRLDETQAPPINIESPKLSIEDSRTQEKSILIKQEEVMGASQESNKPLQIDSDRSELIKEKETSYKKRIPAKDNSEWDIYKERVFVKTLLHQRFNYFIIIYTLTILSASIISVKILQSVVLVTGFFIMAMLWFNLVRVYIELEEIYKRLHKAASQYNILDIIKREANKRQSFLGQLPINSIIAYGIPVLCLVSICCYLAIILFLL